MFSLLSPISLWFGALLAVPLVIHFLGRQRLDRQPFPSLLLVKEGFARSMQRHRLKNLLLLIIRTLLIACLLLALSNPAVESRKAAARPDASLALIHNGIYGKLSIASAPGKTALEAQRLRVRALDSTLGTRSRLFSVIADGAGSMEVSERFGAYGDAVRKLLAELGAGTAQVTVPVFAWAEAVACQADLLRAVKDMPGLQVVLTDYSEASARTAAFAGLRATPAPDAPTVALSARLSPAAEGESGKTQIHLDGRLFQEAAPTGGRVEVTLPLGAGPRTEGRFSLPQGGFAAPDLHFCFPQAGSWSLAHAGSAMASLPSLGRETYFRRIVHVASAKDVPWGSGAARAPLRLVYLAAGPGASAETYVRAVEFVKQGGRLIIAAGKASDAPLLNRFLLQPMRLGRLGNLVDSAGAVAANREALGRIGRSSGDPAAALAAGVSAAGVGQVRKRYAFAPDSGTELILTQGGAAVLAGRDFHRGQALVWTTDLDDLEWTDLGVSPLVPLLHQAFQEAGAGERAANMTVAADSIYSATLPGGGPESGKAGPAAEVRDPDGRAFTKVRADGTRLRIGPFDKLGIHRVIAGTDTLAFAVNLLPAGSAGGPAPADAEWVDAEARAREAFLTAVKPYHGRIAVLSPDDAVAAQASVRRLWPAFLGAAILLLFLEGLISSAFSARRHPSGP